jgi:hypothetical protein
MIITNFSLIIFGVVSVIAILCISSQVFKLIFAYNVSDSEIIVQLFHALPIYRIPFRKIEKIREAPMYEVALVPGMHFFTRPFGRRVVIEMLDTSIRYAFLTPSDPGAFIAEVKRHMTNA